MSPGVLVGVGGTATLLLMAGLWVWHLRSGNAAIVDVGWAASLVLLAGLYGALGGGAAWRRAVIASMVITWGLRLAGFLLVTRVIGQPEDARYTELRRRWGGAAPARFFVFFEAQGGLAVVLALPVLIAASNPDPTVSWLEYLAPLVWLGGLLGETVADAQLRAFKAGKDGRRRTCRHGLWRYSRHPNYFFEWMMWVSYAIFALPSPYGFAGLLSPAVMLYLLFRVTGIPATEAQALKTKGEDYRRYQATTSAFIPWIPRS